jgi:hypothetical protein
MMETYETTQPWIVYTYGATHDGWWPLWNSTRILGYCKIGLLCCVCGKREVVKLKLPRFGPVQEPASGRHVERERFLREHLHPERGAPMSWVVPLKNLAAHPGGLNLDLLAMRLEADLNEGKES